MAKRRDKSDGVLASDRDAAITEAVESMGGWVDEAQRFPEYNPAAQIAETWQRVTGLRPGKLATVTDIYGGQEEVEIVDLVITDAGIQGISFILNGHQTYLPWRQVGSVTVKTDE